MALMKISKYLEYLEKTKGIHKDSLPSRSTIINQINAGELYGEMIGNLWYIDPARKATIIPVNKLAESVLYSYEHGQKT